jgi:magnesium transporter
MTLEDDEEGSLYTSIGIAIAISGNVLISLALNIQKVAHNQLHRARQTSGDSSSPNTLSSENILDNDESRRPLLPRSSTPSVNHYGAANANGKKFWSLPKLTTLPKPHSIPVLSPQVANGDLDDDDELHEAQGTESDYLKSKLWYPIYPVSQYILTRHKVARFLSHERWRDWQFPLVCLSRSAMVLD